MADIDFQPEAETIDFQPDPQPPKKGTGLMLPMVPRRPEEAGARLMGLGEPLISLPRLSGRDPRLAAFITGMTGQPTPPQTAENVAAVANVAKTLPEFLTSPLGVATAPIAAAGGVPARLLGLGFVGQMARDVPEAAREAGRLSVEGPPQEAKEALLGLGANVVLPATLTAGALRTRQIRPKPAQEALPQSDTPTEPVSTVPTEAITPSPEALRRLRSKVKTTIRKPFEAGQKAAAEGQAEADNPYVEGSAEAAAWNNGLRTPKAPLPGAQAPQTPPEALPAPPSPVPEAQVAPEGVPAPEVAAAAPQAEPVVAEPTQEAPAPVAEPAATIEATPLAGKMLGEWEAVKTAAELPKGAARAELAKWLAVPNQPARILQALGNKRRTREIHAPPPAEVSRVGAEPVSTEARPRHPLEDLLSMDANQLRETINTSEAALGRLLHAEQTAAVIARTTLESARASNAKLLLNDPDGHGRKAIETYIQQSRQAPAAATPEPAPEAPPAEPQVEQAAAKAQAEVSKTATVEGQRPAKEVKQDLIDGLQQALMKAPREAKEGDKVTIAIPGDGTFKVVNAVEPISEVLARAKKIETNPNKPTKISKKQIQASSRIIAKSAPTPPSMGPGAAAAEDQPAAPRQALAAAAPVESGTERPQGLISPISLSINNTLKELDVILRGLAGETLPRTTKANRATGEAGARYLASSVAALPQARKFSTAALEGTGADPVKFGAALVEDNLNSIREGFRAQVTDLMAEGKQEEAEAARAAADNVATIIGSKGSPFATQDEYFDYLNQPEVKKAIAQHIQQWKDVVEPMYRRAQSLDPDTELPTRGQQTGARVNLKVILPGDERTTTSRGAGGASLTKTFKRRSPFAIKAKGSGEVYETNYHDIIANTFQRQLEIANKNAFDRALIETGLSAVAPPGRNVNVSGQRGVPFPLTRRVLLTKGQVIPLGQNLYVRSDLAGEYRRASNVDQPFRIPYVTPTMNFMNQVALKALTDFTVHTGNLMTAIFNRPNSGSLLSDTLLSLTGRADIPVTLFKALVKGFQNNQSQLAELAEIAASRPEQAGTFKWGTNRILRSIDSVSRVVLDDTYKQLAADGIVPNSETARREFANQVGQYNRRAQGPVTRWLRDTGFGPFATAGKTFNALAIRMATLSPGVEAASIPAAIALRANVLSKWVGAAALIGTLNYLLTSTKGGGVMGRKGTPLGYIDTGTDDAQGKPLIVPAADIIGLGRALRVTGAKGAIDAKRFGLTDADAVEGATRDIINAAIGPVAGPPVRFGFIAGSGYPPAISVGRASPVAAPGTSQHLENIKAAIIQSNPAFQTYFDWRAGKPWTELTKRQMPRFSLTPGKAPELIDRYPKVVNLAQTYAWVDYLASQARGMDQGRRNRFISDALNQVEPQNRKLVTDLLKRHKIKFAYVPPE